MNEFSLTIDEKTDPLRVKIERSIERLRAHEPADGYYFADSYGKDSCVCLKLLQMSGVKFDAHHNLTTVDPPELIYFGREYHPGTIVHRPEKNMFQLIAEHTIPPTRSARYCCQHLKEGRGSGRLIVTGIRWAESLKRSKRRLVETCMSDNTKTFLHPIIDWQENDVWDFIHSYNIPYCNLYDQGCKRIGCIMCPQKSGKAMLRDAERWPKYAAAYKRAMGKMLELQKDKIYGFKCADDVYEWWVRDKKDETDNYSPLLPFEDQ